MRTRGMHHISLKVAEDCYQATVGFYRDLLELKVVRIQDTATFLSSGNVTIEILKSDKVQAEKGAVDHIAFLVDDAEYSPQSWISRDNGTHQAYVYRRSSILRIYCFCCWPCWRVY